MSNEHRTLTRTIAPNTTPYGDVIKHDVLWATRPVFAWNPKTKQMEWDREEIDRTQYLTIGGTTRRIPKGSCRLCGEEIKPYPTKYFQKHYENGMKYCFLYDAASYFCEACARKEAGEEFSNDILPREAYRFTSMRDEQQVDTIVYEDGSRLEELTSRELARAQMA